MRLPSRLDFRDDRRKREKGSSEYLARARHVRRRRPSRPHHSAPMSRPGSDPRHRTPMPTSTRKPSPYERAGSAEINTMVARVAPAILALLADGVPRTKPAIVEALAGRHDKQDVVHALFRLAVTGQVSEAGGKYTLAAAEL